MAVRQIGSRTVRAAALATFVVLAAIYVAFQGFGPQTLGDYRAEAAPAMHALLAGHLHGFFALQPPYGGSLLLRAPFALLAKALGGGELAIYRGGALLCVLACGLLGALLATRLRRPGQGLALWLLPLLLCALAPLITDAIRYGHPEEALGGALCVGAVLLAADGRSTLAGLALGLAIVNKQWAVLALIPALLAVPAIGGRLRGRLRLFGLAAGLPAAQLLAVHLELRGGAFGLVSGAQQAGYAHSFDIWWPLAHASRHLGVGSPPFWITNWSPPALIASHAHELIVVLCVPLALLTVGRRGWRLPVDLSLALLALLFLLRCMLDPQDLFYYHLPFVLALVAWEAHVRRGVPWLSVGALVLLYVVFNVVGASDAHTWAGFATYLAVTVPLTAYLLFRVLISSSRVATRAKPVGGVGAVGTADRAWHVLRGYRPGL